MNAADMDALELGWALIALAEGHARWSAAKIGPDDVLGPVGPLRHLAKEALEAAENPGDVREYADCLLCFVHASRAGGFTLLEVVREGQDKLAANWLREWPKAVPGVPCEHVRFGAAILDKFGTCDNTIKVAAGHYVNLKEPDPATIEIKSIAAGLSKICRFGGQSPVFYSVAEHSTHAAELAAADGVRGEALLAIFLHDAAEAYVGDVVKPLKLLLPEYAEVERRMESAVGAAFGVDFGRHAEAVKKYDRAMLKAEKTALWPDDAAKWVGFGDIGLRDVRFHFWGPRVAEERFLFFACQLGIGGAS